MCKRAKQATDLDIIIEERKIMGRNAKQACYEKLICYRLQYFFTFVYAIAENKIFSCQYLVISRTVR